MTTTAILVHGAWADGSSWSGIIPRLLDAQLGVVAVQLPLTSLDDDAAATRRAIARVDGPVLLVGHSYGGAVITQVGDDPKVRGLVYVAAFVPDVGESTSTLGAQVPPSPAGAEIRADADGFLVLTPKGVHEDFAQDLPAVDRRTMVATQGPTSVHALGGKVTAAGWRGKPCWYVLATQDRTIPPALQEIMSARIEAETVCVSSSHVPMLSLPDDVARIIVDAALTAGKS